MSETPPLVLIVDDEPLNLEVIGSYLHATGYRIARAGNGEDALNIVSENPPDLILLDVMMPGMDGFEVCKRLKEGEGTRFIPVVIVTSLDQHSDKIAAIQAGADDFITKPVDKTELLARSASLLRMKEYHDERNNAYADIRQITVFFNEAVRAFDPLNFSLDAVYDSMFTTLLRKRAEEKEKPTHAMVIPYARSGFESGKLYTMKGGSVMERQVSLEDLAGLSGALGFNDRKDGFINLPNPGDGQAVVVPQFPQSIIKETGPVANLAFCYTETMLLASINYGRQAGPFDVEVIKDLAMHAIFFDTIAGQVKENEDAFLYTIKALARAAEVNDEDTGNHIIRVNEYAYEIASESGLPPKLVDEIRHSAQMHDVGKLHTPPEILRKPGKLTPDEWEEVKKHTTYGVKILGGSPRLETARQIALNHHERWDGTGYPNGLKGEDIPLVGRIVALCDVYDALRNKRVYKPAFDHATTYKIITEGDGRTLPGHFDPQVLATFRRISRRFEEIYLEFN